MPEILTDEQAAAIWSGQTSSILGLEPTVVKTSEELAAEKLVADEKVKKEAETTTTTTVANKDLDNAFSTTEEVDEEETTTTSTETKKGRKPTDLVQLVNQLITEDILFAAEDDKGLVVELKTIEDAKNLIKANLEYKEKQSNENWRDDYKKGFSPQVQAVLHYAEQGAQSATQIAQLLGAIQQVEEAVELDLETPAGQEQAVRQTLKSKGFKDTYIDKQVNTLKDLGGDKLKEEAKELYPELVETRREQVKQVMANQDARRKEAEEASKIYVDTIRQTLDKDVIGGIKLSRDDKAKLYEAVTQPRYMSLNGSNTNLFVKTLEELQFGKNANYEQFMNIVQYTIDPKGFIEKLKTSVGNDIAESTFVKLKTSKSTTPNTDATDNASRSTSKKTLPKGDRFVNPYA